MITQLVLHNYRSLGLKVPLTLGRLTALVGAPGSGADHVVDALGFMSECLREGLDPALSRREGMDVLSRWDGEKFLDVSLSAFVRNERGFGYWEFWLSRNEDGSALVKVEAAFWQPTGQQRIDHFKINEGQWIQRMKDLEFPLEPTALTLPLVADDPRFQELTHELRQIAVYRFFPERLDESSEPTSQQTASAPSDLMADLQRSPPLALIAIEQPERTAPPGTLPVLRDFLRQSSLRSQLLLTTHSPELLELLDVAEVRVVDSRDSTTRVTRLVDSQREDVMRSLSAPAQSV